VNPVSVAYSNTTVDEDPADVTVPLNVAAVAPTDVEEEIVALVYIKVDSVAPCAVPPVLVIFTA
jgi:hypothetical protein